MTIEFLLAYLAMGRMASAKRPSAHRTKKGPGRKHQQTKTLTKQEREAQEKANA